MGAGVEGPHFADEFGAVTVGEAEVHYGNVYGPRRVAFPGEQGPRLGNGAGLARDLHVGFGVEGGGHHLPYDGVVLHQEHPHDSGHFCGLTRPYFRFSLVCSRRRHEPLPWLP